MSVVRTALVAILLVGGAPLAWAGAWTIPRNHWYVEYFYRYFYNKRDFDADGESVRKVKAGIFRDIRNEFKLEYGVLDELTFLASVPYQSAHFRDDSVDLLNANVGDIWLRTKWRLLEEPIVTSLQTSWKIPSAYDPNESPGLGDGQFDFETRLILSRAWNFDPYQAQVSRQPSDPSPRYSGTQREILTTLAREVAIRDALLLAELRLQATRLLETGRLDEAVRWERAADEHALQTMRIALDASPSDLPDEPVQFAATRLAAGGLPGASEEPRAVPLSSSAAETRYRRQVYVNLETGFNARNEDPANEFPMLAELGIAPLERVMLIGSVEGTVSVNSTHEQIENFGKWGLRGIVNLWGEGFPSVFRRLEQHETSVNVEIGYNELFAGRNTADAFEIFSKLAVIF